jgi:TRAP-type C4-dicarboxylate transport system permease small subunit
MQPDGEDRYSILANRLARIGARLACVALVLIVALVLAEIGSRNLLNRSTMIADEMCGYLNVAVVFLGLAYTMHEGGFIRVELVYKTFKGAMKAIADWYNVLVSTAFALIMLYYLSRYTLYSYQNNIRSAEVTATPQYLPQLFAVAGTLLLAIYLVKFIVNKCRNVP